MDQYIRAQLLKADLIEIDKSFTENGINSFQSILLLKQALILISSFYDFENSVKSIYRKHPELSQVFKTISKECKFAKYLRNKFAGHIKQELIIKAIEWRPELRMLLSRMDDIETMTFVNVYVLETAINTYVDSKGDHCIFDSETDLMYRPDKARFLIFLANTIAGAIDYLVMYIQLTVPGLASEIEDSSNFEHAIRAGETRFEFIKK